MPALLGVLFQCRKVGKQIQKPSGNDHSDGKPHSKMEGRIHTGAWSSDGWSTLRLLEECFGQRESRCSWQGLSKFTDRKKVVL